MALNQKGQEQIKRIIYGLVGAFLAFTAHWVFINRPEVYATKRQVQDIKQDICADIVGMEHRLQKQIDSLHEDVKFIRQWYGPAKNP